MTKDELKRKIDIYLGRTVIEAEESAYLKLEFDSFFDWLYPKPKPKIVRPVRASDEARVYDATGKQVAQCSNQDEAQLLVDTLNESQP